MVGVGGTTSATGYASPNDVGDYYLKSRGFNGLFSQNEVPFLLPSSSFLKLRFEFSNFHCSASLACSQLSFSDSSLRDRKLMSEVRSTK